MSHQKKLTKKQWVLYAVILLLFTALILCAFQFTSDTRKFNSLSQKIFASELSGDTLSLHYTLAYPQKYDLDKEAVLPTYSSGESNSAAEITSLLDELSKISPDHLSEGDAYAYNLLVRYLTLHLSGSNFQYFSEPLSPSSGMQSGLPILLADYTFRSEKDVEDYLNLLDQTDEYFQGLIQYENEKSTHGLFMSNTAASKIVRQCSSIMDKEALSTGTHFLHTTFRERLDVMEAEGLISSEQKDKWLVKNDRLLTTVMEPAYENVADAFTILNGSGQNNMGVCYYPEGRSYYEYLLASITGSSRSIADIKQMLFTDFQQNYTALAQILNTYPELLSMSDEHTYLLPFNSAQEMLSDLQMRMADDFPVFPQAENNFTPSCTIKRISSAMENYSSPAYYLTPPIDDMSHNIIYINHKNSPDALTLYTTLAHEGYPGHLYQTVYSQIYLNEQDAPIVRSILHYGGYVEGWALYVENLSYYYAQSVVKDQDPLEAAWYEACRLNRNLQLCLFSLLDISINYEAATPAKVQAILQKIGIADPNASASIYDYIVEEPVTYLKYYLGFLEFQELKNEAARLWGTDFTLKQFHQFVLETGPSDFQGLRERLYAKSGSTS